ncbi:MAG: dTDP-glucose 4,6-dehydratase [Candidatus Moranbacteria bacterium GW2011_GWE1_36_7]|nr:MAG: dTDP-glucose 4,6-dehydratase [Candidatus Moranbacteria bacterium GW2011_GWD2_36_12]KKQ06313.1 MAG: dTDP-glucose 4,6-dehydratase [Candidatus Moranbacteria bacterium GW2011_GWE2_36_40]KKQ13973.1 MAG: dTDP-glucose 4,6-dehydratase [Candidatus Moranbacteria bacterium GW2011_GWE1_36_7]
MRLLITGGAGFIGSNFVHYILKKYPDYEVINLDALTYAGNLENLKNLENNPRHRFIKGDICDADLVDKLAKEVDIIVHFAAESHVDRSILDSAAFVRTNVIGTHTLLEAAKKAGNLRFHHVSTDEVFGSLGSQDAPFSEVTPYDPRSPYSASKAGSDHLVRAYFHTHNLPVTISNCSNNYGPYHFPEKLIPLVITNLMEGKKIPIYGDGLQVRDWLHVEDHCRAIDAIIHKGKIGETYCVGGNSEKTNMDIVKTILEILCRDESWIEHVEDRKGHDKRYAINFDKIKNELGWQSQVAFEDGIKKTVQWFIENESWWKNIKSGEYEKYYQEQYKK